MHEKSILLPLLPVTLLAHGHPGLAMWLCTVATFSMFPLLKKDGLSLAYAASLLMWAGIALLQPSLPQVECCCLRVLCLTCSGHSASLLAAVLRHSSQTLLLIVTSHVPVSEHGNLLGEHA